MKNTLCCLLQNRLGALDRVLGALTYRGILPEQLVSNIDPKSNCIQLIVTFECNEDNAVEKLVKFLNNQIYVLEVERVLVGKQETYSLTNDSNIASIFSPTYTRRRLSHASNA